MEPILREITDEEVRRYQEDGVVLLKQLFNKEWVARLREAALQDEQGEALDGAIQTLKSFTDVPVDVASGA